MVPIAISIRKQRPFWINAAIVVLGIVVLTLSPRSHVAMAEVSAPATIVNANITTNTTWNEAGSPYEVTTSIAVEEGASLTIEPGVVVRASQSVEINVKGTLHANGTAAKPILFTGTTAQPGWWYGVSFNGKSTAPLTGSNLDYTTVEYGGRSNYANLSFYYATANVAHSTFRHSAANGIRGLSQGFANVSDSSFSNNAGYAIDFSDGSLRPQFANLTVSDNGTDAIHIGSGTLAGDYTWRSLGVPYVFDSLIIAPDVTLTIEAGVEARFLQGSELNVQGKLLANGTANAPILLTGTSAQAGHWYGVSFNGKASAPLVGSTLDYTTIEYGGRSNYANLNLYYAAVALNHSTIRNSAASGVHGLTQGVVNTTDSTFTNNATYPIDLGDGSVRPLFANLTVSGNGTNAIYIGTGTLADDYTWRSLGVPYVFDTLIIAPSVTLTIEAGVEARFAQGAELNIQGTLRAKGSAAQPILLTGTNAQPGHWYGVSFNGKSAAPLSGSTLDYVTIEYGGRSNYANLNLYYAHVEVDHSTFRHSAASGVRQISEGPSTFVNSSFTDNVNYPIEFETGSANPTLANIAASNNGTNAIYVAGGTLSGERTWQAIGLPYIFGAMLVPAGSTLTVEAGVEARFVEGGALTVHGRLSAVGFAERPITFTATSPTPNWWYGISLNGSSNASAMAELDNVTIEYSGRSNYANLSLHLAQATIKHSLIHLGGANGMTVSGGSTVTVEDSKLIDNANYAIQNSSGNEADIVHAANNWWGAANGPTADGSCNPGGSGSKVSVGVAFKPFLSSADQEPAPMLASDERIISITPKRWFAPADGLTRLYVTLALHDGNGLPLPGRTLRLTGSLGNITSGGVTNVQGETLAYLTSQAAGEATLSANFDRTGCETAKTPTAKVTFTAPTAGDLMADAEAPYFNSSIQINPEPIVRGVPTQLSAKLVNPNDFPIVVDATFGYVQSSIGLAFDPVGEVTGKVIPAKSTGDISVVWTPSVSGHYCVQLTYTSRPADVTASDTSATLQAGRSQRNLQVYPGPLGSPNEKDSLNKADKAFNAVSKTPGTKQLPIQKFILSKWWGWVKDTASKISQNLGGDPPRQDYKTIATVNRISLPPLSGDGQISAARVAAINAVTEALLDANAYGEAATISLDRYGGAAAANDLQWMSLQSGSLIYYKQEMAKALLTAADRIDALHELIIAEGTTSVTVTADEFQAYQQELATTGFTAQDIADAKQAGLDDADIEAHKQEILATDPDEAAGDLLVRMEAWATEYRALGNAILHPPLPNFSISGGRQQMAAEFNANPDNLARVFNTVSTIQLGNPYPTTTTIDLVARPVDLPADWLVSISPISATLAPGAQTSVTVTIVPGSAAVQGTTPRVAIEGYAGSELIGGVAVDVMVPNYTPFDGELRVYLPLVDR